LDGLSGGERRRLSLAILVHSGSNVLILDEPTNHLDLESREALESALREFAGSLLLVSHDRALLDAIGTRTVALEDQTLHSYVGGWPEYLRVREERAKAPAPSKAKAAAAGSKVNGKGAAKKRNPPRPKPGRGSAGLEADIEAAEAALRTIEEELADPAAWAGPEATARSSARHEEAKLRVAELYERWEAVAG
jgi:ATP-binding cassette subfamily F protein 3